MIDRKLLFRGLLFIITTWRWKSFCTKSFTTIITGIVQWNNAFIQMSTSACDWTETKGNLFLSKRQIVVYTIKFSALSMRGNDKNKPLSVVIINHVSSNKYNGIDCKRRRHSHSHSIFPVINRKKQNNTTTPHLVANGLGQLWHR